MLVRRPSVALLFVLVLSAMALSPAAERAVGDKGLSTGGDVVAAVRFGWPDVSLARLSGEEQHNVVATQRSMKQQMLLLAAGAALLLPALLGRRRAMLLVEDGRPGVSWWSARTGRAPPSPSV